ncbi:MAG: ATP-dependent DNA helicase RecG [Coriobacteriia bacterium]|nr:ATP-dependent DNA helicase RecG [Coriobacteriia bacterium]
MACASAPAPPAPAPRVDRRRCRDLPVTAARFIDQARAEALGRLNIQTVGDLLYHIPFRYLDLSTVSRIKDAAIGSDLTVVGTVREIQVKKPRPRLNIVEVAIVDEGGALLGVWFNQPWVSSHFKEGDVVALSGKVEFSFGMKQMRSPFYEKLASTADAGGLARGRVLPVHRTTEGLTTVWLRRLVAAAVDDYSDIADHLPASFRVAHGLVPLSRALRDIHFPPTLEAARAARRRLAYDEVLLLQLYMAKRRHAHMHGRAGIAHTVNGPLKAALDKMPPTLTGDQQRAVAEILADMSSAPPMNRLLLGDVGTGKTLVATHALAAAADSGGQAAMMAPTEVLAAQYAEKVGPQLTSLGVSWELLTGSTSAAKRRDALARIGDGSTSVVFGTHALLEKGVAFDRLTLAIVDEQHRFGVEQRLGLRSKGEAADLLVMTATPIPRSLALTLYGDLATSYLRERPHSAAGVTTHLTTIAASGKAHAAVRKAVKAGRQAYVVCAVVEESDIAEVRAATREATRLQNEVFPDLKVGLLTGRMRPAEKAATMQRFREGSIDVLVATTVIEVGVDVTNATVMLIENAERFGLAQLHQLRGRVGRGGHPGEVWLVSDARSREARERLAVLERTSDGFVLAEHDLRIRGEGQLLGDKQHGLPDFRIASLAEDIGLIELARKDAGALIERDPELDDPLHAPLLYELRRMFAEAWEWVSAG